MDLMCSFDQVIHHIKLYIVHDCCLLVSTYVCLLLQKLAASLSEKGLSPETGISASDEAGFGRSFTSYLQYGDSLSVINQINTHGYPGMVCSSRAASGSIRRLPL